jgi:DNA-binding GntR family transcriptional regulator
MDAWAASKCRSSGVATQTKSTPCLRSCPIESGSLKLWNEPIRDPAAWRYASARLPVRLATAASSTSQRPNARSYSPPHGPLEKRAVRLVEDHPHADHYVIQTPPAWTKRMSGSCCRIVRGELTGGTELKSTQIAQQLGISRTPVVQALQRLAADGIVTLEMNKRAVVRPGAENWLVELHELRELLEPAAAARAAREVTAADLDRLDILAAEARPHSHPAWPAAAQRFDFALHLTIADRSGNFALAMALRKIWTFKRISYLAVPEPAETLERGYSEHMALLSALRTRDAETARAAMLFHLRSASSLRSSRTIV